jgi:hypothetical protein
VSGRLVAGAETRRSWPESASAGGGEKGIFFWVAEGGGAGRRWSAIGLRNFVKFCWAQTFVSLRWAKIQNRLANSSAGKGELMLNCVRVV